MGDSNAKDMNRLVSTATTSCARAFHVARVLGYDGAARCGPDLRQATRRAGSNVYQIGEQNNDKLAAFKRRQAQADVATKLARRQAKAQFVRGTCSMSSNVSPQMAPQMDLEQAIQLNLTSHRRPHRGQRNASNIDEPEAISNLRAELAGLRGQLVQLEAVTKSPSKIDLRAEFGL